MWLVLFLYLNVISFLFCDGIDEVLTLLEDLEQYRDLLDQGNSDWKKVTIVDRVRISQLQIGNHTSFGLNSE